MSRFFALLKETPCFYLFCKEPGDTNFYPFLGLFTLLQKLTSWQTKFEVGAQLIEFRQLRVLAPRVNGKRKFVFIRQCRGKEILTE
jgi:hypothetical protein